MSGAGAPARISRRGALAVGAGSLAACSRSAAGPGSKGGRLTGQWWPGGSAAWRLAMPSDGHPRALVVVLHGKGGDADSAFDMGFQKHLDGPRLAMASVSGGDGYWHARRSGPQAGTDSGEGVLRQLIPSALKAAGLPPSAKVGFLGYSMGGYGSMLLAPRLRSRCLGVAAMSAALWTSAGLTAPGAFDHADDFRRHDVFTHLSRLRRVPMNLRCGTEDPFIAANRLLVRRRPATAHVFDGGGHDEDYWSRHAPGLLDWLGRRSG